MCAMHAVNLAADGERVELQRGWRPWALSGGVRATWPEPEASVRVDRQDQEMGADTASEAAQGHCGCGRWWPLSPH